ncbi:Pherophorin-domain-containing protein [Haematococcus lacustris]
MTTRFAVALVATLMLMAMPEHATAARPSPTAATDPLQEYYTPYTEPPPAAATPDSNADTAALLNFPFCTCTDYRCGSSPWKLVPQPVRTTTQPDIRVLCFKFNFTGCAVRSQCCDILTNDVGKVEFAIDKSCTRSFVVNTTLNNVTRIGATFVDLDFAQGKLRVSNLRMSGAGAIAGSELCLWMRTPCTSAATLFADRDGTFKTAVFNTNHSCCPVCIGGEPTECDCISVYNPNTRWRLSFKNADIYAGQLYYGFRIYAVPSSSCAQTSYRPGFCCDQTLESIQLDLDMATYNTTYFNLVQDYTLILASGTVLQQGPVSTPQWSLTGLVIEGFAPLRPDDFPASQELSLVLRVDSAILRPGMPFPCGPSRLSTTPGVCDYMLTGKQVLNGQVFLTDPADRISQVPGCCPEGVYAMPGPQQCGCTDNKLDSPFRLTVLDPTQAIANGATVHAFILRTVAVQLPLREPGNPANCTNQDVDRIRLYIRPSLVNQIESITVDGVACGFAYGQEGSSSWVELTALDIAFVAASTHNIQVTLLDNAPVEPSLCAANALGTAECEYVFYGNWNMANVDYDCCSHGYSDPRTTMSIQSEETCDTNILHSSYRLVSSGVTYNAAADESTAAFQVIYTAGSCDTYSDELDCCNSDIKAIFLGLAGPAIKRVASMPDFSPTATSDSHGINITGIFGQGSTFDLYVVLDGQHSAASLTQGTGDNFEYRLQGSADINEPMLCCPTHLAPLA